MSYYNDCIDVSHYGDSYHQSVISECHPKYNFHKVDEFFRGIKSFCRNATKERNQIIIALSGQVQANNFNFEQENRLFRGQAISEFRSVNHLAQLDHIEYFLSRECEFMNEEGFCKRYKDKIQKIGELNIKPEFYGIGVEFLTSNYFAMGYPLFKVIGPDADIFHSAQAIMG